MQNSSNQAFYIILEGDIYSSLFVVNSQLLKNLVERRRMVKSWLKTASGLKAQQFDIQQQALKLTANRSHCFCYMHMHTLYILVLLDASSSY